MKHLQYLALDLAQDLAQDRALVVAVVSQRQIQKVQALMAQRDRPLYQDKRVIPNNPSRFNR